MLLHNAPPAFPVFPMRQKRPSWVHGLLITLMVIIVAGCGGGNAKSKATDTNATGPSPWGLPVAGTPGAPLPTDPRPGQPGGAPIVASVTAFSNTVYPLLTQHCSECHSGDGPGNPNIAHADVQTAHDAVVLNQKVDFTDPQRSRLVQRLSADFHGCWNECQNDAQLILAVINDWAQLIGVDAGTSPVVSDQEIVSAAVTLADGTKAAQQRVRSNLIALYEFKEGVGNVASDTSGVQPAMDLELSGFDWVGGGGIENFSGKASAAPETSRKLFDRIAGGATPSNQYSVEAWIVPDNIDQEGPARIVTYAQDPINNNFMMGQVNYNYRFRNRNSDPDINANGEPSLQTADADRRAKATLQHVVMTYDLQNGRRIYVDGQHTGDADTSTPADLSNWNAGYTFTIGNIRSDNRLWKGQVKLVAVYDRALSAAQVKQNFDAGVGEKFLLRFDIGALINTPDSFIEMEVSEFDAYSYLLSKPAFVAPSTNGVRVKNMRIAVNNNIQAAGQAFSTIDTTVLASPMSLSTLGSVIAKDQGPANDRFTLAFEILGDKQNVIIEATPTPPARTGGAKAYPAIGIRNFAQINDTMAAVTGVDPTTPAIADTFAELQQQLPGNHDVNAFLSSHQVGISKLALEYCDALVESSALRTAFFGTNPAVNFAATVDQALGAQSQRDVVVNRLIEKMVGVNIAGQPSVAEMHPELNSLIVDLSRGCPGGAACDAARTRTIIKASCAAVLSSAPVLIQ